MTEKEWQAHFWKPVELCKLAAEMLKTLLPSKTAIARRRVRARAEQIASVYKMSVEIKKGGEDGRE